MADHGEAPEPFARVAVRNLAKGTKYKIKKIRVKECYVRRHYISGLEAFVVTPNGRRLRFFLPTKYNKLSQSTIAGINFDCRHGMPWHFVFYGIVGTTCVSLLHRPGCGKISFSPVDES